MRDWRAGNNPEERVLGRLGPEETENQEREHEKDKQGFEDRAAIANRFDRAAIKYLGLPSNTYSTFEPPYFTENAIRIPDPANYVLGFGIFRNRTVQQAFEEAKYNEASHATMDLYLHIDPATEKDPVKREGLYAIQQYLALYRSRGCQ
mgnify:CR=1 FL=1